MLFSKNGEFTMYRIVLLLICMDIHFNPGPTLSLGGTLNLFHLNSRIIRGKFDNILDICDEHDILGFTETHLDGNILTAILSIDEFNEPYRKDRNCHGAGILVYTSNTILSTSRVNLECPDIETIWIELTIQGRHFSTIFVIYDGQFPQLEEHIVPGSEPATFR